MEDKEKDKYNSLFWVIVFILLMILLFVPNSNGKEEVEDKPKTIEI